MNRRSILAAYKKKSSHLQTGVTGFKSGNLFAIVRYTVKLRAVRRDFMRCAQPAVRRGHCARRRVSERNRRTAAALSAEIDTRPTFLPEKGLFRQTEAGEHFCSPAFYGL